MEQAETKSFRRDDGVLFTRAATVYAKVEDRDALMAAIEAEGLQEDMTKLDFQKARLNEWVRTALDEGRALMDGLSASVTTYVSRRAK